jgi:hypothetical protein
MTPIVHHFTGLPPDSSILTITIGPAVVTFTHMRPDDDSSECAVLTPAEIIRTLDL